MPIAGFLRLLFLWLSFISLTIELSLTTYKSPNSVATLLRSHGIFKRRSAMAREAAGEDQPNQETAVSCRSLTALSAPIIYLVESHLYVKMQLLIASHSYIFGYSELHCGVRTEATQGIINVIINRFQSFRFKKCALGKNSAQEVGRRSG